ncbi:hypothetical protein SteCoe_15184 [Stentor coeruleus]|uniref:Histidine kinase n=1 Tax=Stentor coeruleus TaxID=5963 RepID=A0A1R2C4G7_9CILI|nr:hypothetical protein SteCoe_15184 [Stentor coeruleus]
MRSEWWNAFFYQSFERLRVSFTTIICLQMISIVSQSIIFSVQLALSPANIEQILMALLAKAFLHLLKNTSLASQKVGLYLTIEAVNVSLKIFSNNHPAHYLVNLSGSTAITMYFQTSIFQKAWPNIFIAIKHIVLWYEHDLTIIFSNELVTAFEMAIFTLVLVFSFEMQKRNCIQKLNCSKILQQEALHQFSEIFRVFPDGLIIFNKSFELKFQNETSFKIFGENKGDLHLILSEIKNKDSDNFISDLIKKEFFHKEFTSNEGFKNADIKVLGVTEIKNSVYQWTIKHVRWEHEDCCMAILKDVTNIFALERKEAENKGKAAVMRSVSHELRTPVNGITLIVDKLLTKVPNRYHKKLSYIKICANLLKFQISDIIDYTKLATGNFIINSTKCQIKKHLQECVDYVKVQALYKGIDIISKIDELIPDECIIDGYRLQKAIMNLLSNAIKYTSKGTIELCAVHTGHGIHVSVKDTGIGIPEARLEQIFEMLNDDSKSGLCGLGLYITKAILKNMGSAIKVSSTFGKGSIFSFDLNVFEPLCEETEESEIPDENLSLNDIPNLNYRALISRPAQILIVDDNDFNRMSLASILRSEGIGFLEAINGEDAIKTVLKCDRLGVNLKCVIMDCNMPVTDGWEASYRIKNKYAQGIIKNFPAIIGYTAYSAKEDIQKCYDSGMISYMLKPTARDDFLSIISRYI